MLSSVVQYINQHKGKIIISGVCIGGAVLCSQYVKNAVERIRIKEAREILERAKKQRHFDYTDVLCNRTAHTQLVELLEKVIDLVGTEALVEKLKLDKVENKIAAWERLKVLAFTKVMTMVYASSLLLVSLRIQTSLISGFLYRGEISDKSCHETKNFVSDEFKNVHLSKLVQYIEDKVASVIGPKSFKDRMKIRDIENIFWAFHSAISLDPGDPCKHLTEFIIPDYSERMALDTFGRMITLMCDFLDSSEVQNQARTCVIRGLTFAIDELRSRFRTLEQEKKDTFVGLNEISLPMAKVIPIVDKLVVINSNDSNDFYEQWVPQLIMMDSLKVLSANVYEAISYKP